MTMRGVADFWNRLPQVSVLGNFVQVAVQGVLRARKGSKVLVGNAEAQVERQWRTELEFEELLETEIEVTNHLGAPAGA